MKTAANVVLGVVIGGAVACAVVHRKVIVAMVKGQELPEPPEWHKKWHSCFNK